MLLKWFDDLNASRVWGMQSPQRIQYAEYAAWLSLTGVQVTLREVQILRKMDVAWCSAISVESEAIETRRAAEAD